MKTDERQGQSCKSRCHNYVHMLFLRPLPFGILKRTKRGASWGAQSRRSHKAVKKEQQHRQINSATLL